MTRKSIQQAFASPRALRWVAALSLLLISGVSYYVWAQDGDSDGMSDAYENFFGLNPTNAADAAYNSDDDTLTNITESVKWTDPFYGDSDRDGWKDGVDNNPTSRVYIAWGDDFFTDTNNVYEYAGPVWWVRAYSTGGTLSTNSPTSWQAASTQTVDTGSVSVDVNRSKITNNVVMKVDFWDYSNATLYVDLYNTNSVVIVTNLLGNIVQGTDARVVTNLSIPLGSYASASGIRVRRGTGAAKIYETKVYIDQDGDGLDKEQEGQLGTSDFNTDSDNDGLSDYDEVFVYGTNPTNGDTDGDTLGDGAEVTAGTDPLSADGDADGMSDPWEITNGLHAVSQPASTIGGWWRLDESSGTTAADSSTNHNDGTISGPTRVSGQVGNALSFDGVNYQVSVANAASYKPSSLTLSARIKADAFYGNTVSNGVSDGTMFIVAQKNSGSGLAYGLYRTPEHALVFELANGSSTGKVRTASGVAVSNKFLNLTGTYDGTNVALYLNGVLVGTTTWTNGISYSSSQGLVLGHAPLSNDGWLNGTVDDVLVLNKALSAADVAYLAEANEDADGDGLSNLQEYQYDTNPNDADLDNDGLLDGEEIIVFGTDVDGVDTDGDGLSDWYEINVSHSNPTAADTDYDGINDRYEVAYGNVTNANNAGLVGWWKLDEMSNFLADSSANANYGTMEGGSLSVIGYSGNVFDYPGMGRMGAALTFDGADDAVSILNATGYKPTTAFTLSLHVNFSGLYGNAVSNGATNGEMTLLSQRSVASTLGFGLYKTETHSLVLEIASATATQRVTTAAGVAVTGGWHHVVGTYDGTNLTLTIDEALAGSAAASFSISTDGSSGMYLARPPSSVRGGWLNGALDEVRVYNVALSSTRLSELLAQENSLLYGDSDGDGIINATEYYYGSNPNSTDTDNDGRGDDVEENTYHQDPAVVSTSPSDTDSDKLNDLEERYMGLSSLTNDGWRLSTVLTINGSDATNSAGPWSIDGTEIYNTSRRGYVDYALVAPGSDVYRMEIRGSAHIPAIADENEYVLDIFLNGERLDRKTLMSHGAGMGAVGLIMPYVKAGTTNSLRIFWDNHEELKAFCVKTITLESIEGDDLNGNGRKDWVEQWLGAMSSLDTVASSSVMSPLFLEGETPYPSMVSITGASGTETNAGLGDRWYGYVPLSSTSATAIVTSLENGGVVQTNNVTWTATNLLAATSTHVRKGTSIRFNAFPVGATDGDITVNLVGSSNYSSTVASPVTHTFSSTGIFTVAGTWTKGSVSYSNNIQIGVWEVSFPTNPALWVDKSREWTCTNFQTSSTIQVQGDYRIAMTDIGYNSTGRKFSMTNDAPVEYGITARLGTKGEILDNATTKGFGNYSSAETYVRVVHTYENGDRLVEMMIVQAPMRDGLEVHLDIFVGGVTFVGGTTSKVLYPSDFNAVGEATVTFNYPAGQPTSVCHTLKIYQDGVLVGER